MLNSVQMLRAAAALGVVFFHLSIFFEQNLPSGFPRFETGVAGVDLFFVISGFIMVYATPPDEAAVGFIARRMRRRRQSLDL